jgi:hypothetical protein
MRLSLYKSSFIFETSVFIRVMTVIYPHYNRNFFFQCDLPHSQTEAQYLITARATTGRHSNAGMSRKQAGFLLPVLRVGITQYSFHPSQDRLTTLQCHGVINIAGSQPINTTLICITCSYSYQLLRTPYLLQCMSGIKSKICKI